MIIWSCYYIVFLFLCFSLRFLTNVTYTQSSETFPSFIHVDNEIAYKLHFVFYYVDMQRL